ncbi:thiamine pyrophosphate-binding protein [Microbacteriaceae bacterium K1510]|nr:thiamine pyrophosphate-binding protein [Microbacteriaceae bacterium K1510]
MARTSRRQVSRRNVLGGIVVAGAAATDITAAATATTAETKPDPAPAARRPSAKVAAAETGAPAEAGHAAGPYASDVMVDVIKSLNIDYVAANPANSFRGLHESLLTYGGNKKPEFLTCMHEESSVAMAHGYFKIAGKPMLVLCHGTVGLQHASMAIYNAWCDRVPVVIIGGNDLDATKRAPLVPTYHSAQDINALVRDFTKWDDTPVSVPHFAESFVRAYKLAMTPPHEPVLLAVDADLQEETVNRASIKIPRYVPTAPPQGDANAVREAAKMLVDAQAPVIVADRLARTPNGMKLLVALAELLNIPVVDQRNRLNFPTTHYLHQTGRAGALIRQADVVLGLELSDFWGTVNTYIDNGQNLRESKVKADAKLISIGTGDYYIKANYQDFQRFQPVDLSIAGDAEATLPALIEAVKVALSADRKNAIAQRADAMRKAWAETRQRTLHAATYGWDASPISTARMCAEIWAQIKDEDWSMVSSDRMCSSWPSRLWPMEKHYHHIGGPGGFGIGYGAPAAVGAALANKAEGRFSLNIQCDGDLMFAPGVLWTAAHHRIPLLTVMHNNRGYHQEVMHVQRMADRRDRVLNDGPIGTQIIGPDIDYAKLAQSMGWYASGPISDPNDLAPALKRAVQAVKAGEPALVDVVTQPR